MTGRRGSTFIATLLIALFAFMPDVGLAQGEEMERAVVRIVNHSQRGDWYTPWNMQRPIQGRGTGFVVNGGRILTNAHIVSDSRACLIFLHGDPRPHPARVVTIGHDCDLALLEPEDKSLLDGIEPVKFGTMPPLRSTVDTFGYPSGGRRLSSTRGVVSRIEVQAYAHSGIDGHLTVQTDAAINPGNSGGPVVRDGVVVGVAFQGISMLENVGYFIPTEVVEHFLEDVEDGEYGGFPDLGVTTGTMENPAARRAARMKEGESGVIVTHLFPESSADGILQTGDLLLSIEGMPIANDGTVNLDGMRFNYGVLNDKKQSGESVTLLRLRDGEREKVTATLKPLDQARRLGNYYDTLPRYFVYGGLVFVPLNRETLKTYGNPWQSTAPKSLFNELVLRKYREPERLLVESVVLLRTLDHSVNMNLVWRKDLLVERVNGVDIKGLASLVEAFEANEEAHHLIEFEQGGRFVVLDREAADGANAEILETYGVREDRRL